MPYRVLISVFLLLASSIWAQVSHSATNEPPRLLFLSSHESKYRPQLYLFDGASPDHLVRVNPELPSGCPGKPWYERVVSFLISTANADSLDPRAGCFRGILDFWVTPDGKHVLYTAETSTLNVYDLHLVELAQPGQSIIVNAAQQEEHRRLYVAAIGPNSKRFIYATMEDLEIESLYVVDISNPELQQRISPGLSEEARVWSPRFSPDGSAIAYIVSPDTSAAQRLYLSFVDRLSDPPIVVADAYRSFGRFDFTARGTHVVYSHRAADYSSVVLFDTSTSNKVVLYEQDGDHNYSVHLTPNRRFLYFGDTQLLDLAKFGISYYSEAEVAENPILTQEYTKAFSPDSRSLLRAPEDPDGGRYLLLTSVENQNTKTPVSPPATNSSFGYGMVFTPDGGSVVYRADFEGQSAYGGLYISAIDGSGEAKRLSTSTEHKVMSFRLSADGRFIAYVADEGYPTLHERGWTLYLLDQENGYVPVKQPGADSTALAEHVLWHRLEFVPPGPAYRD